MTQNSDTASTNEPEHGGDRATEDEQRDRDACETGVQLAGRRGECANREILSSELADAPHAANDEEDDEEEREVRDQAVDEEHDKDGRVIAREVTQVIVHSALSVAPAVWLRNAADIEEPVSIVSAIYSCHVMSSYALAQWLQIAEALCE